MKENERKLKLEFEVLNEEWRRLVMVFGISSLCFYLVQEIYKKNKMNKEKWFFFSLIDF